MRFQELLCRSSRYFFPSTPAASLYYTEKAERRKWSDEICERDNACNKKSHSSGHSHFRQPIYLTEWSFKVVLINNWTRTHNILGPYGLWKLLGANKQA